MLAEALVRPMPFPAMNKWTKISPAVGHNTLLGACHGIFRDALVAEFGSLTEQGDDESEEENREDQELGVPLNEIKRWRKLARKRNLRAMHFMSQKQFLFLNILWMLVSEPAMNLHGLFFSQATWFSHRDPEKAERRRLMLGRFCTMSESPAVEAMEKLTALLLRPDRELDLLFAFCGDRASWPQARVATVRRAVMITLLGQLARKLVFPFQQWPWKLWPLADTSASPEEKEECANQLWDSPCCCLDSSFSQRLQARALEKDDLLEPDTLTFLATVFDHAVMSSTYIERKFANFSRWLDTQKSSTVNLPVLAAKHVTRTLRDSVETWRRRSRPSKSMKNHNKRPAWVKGANVVSRLNGWHCFQREIRETQRRQGQSLAGQEEFVQDAKTLWQQLPEIEKIRYGLRARGTNSIKQATEQAHHMVEPSEPGGPWQMSSIDGRWPMDASVLEKRLAEDSSFASCVKAWQEVGDVQCIAHTSLICQVFVGHIVTDFS